jgi:hypothetical protein
MRSVRKRHNRQARFITPGFGNDQTACPDTAHRAQPRQGKRHKVLPVRRIEEHDVRLRSSGDGQGIHRQHLTTIAGAAGFDICT